MKLCILIPALNEEETIGNVITSIPNSIEGVDEIVILVVDDGSSDRTVELAMECGAIIRSHQETRGVGSAFNTGLIAALELGSDILVNIDADGQFSPDEIHILISPILLGEADFVSGDRFTCEDHKIRKPEHMSSIKFWGNQMMSRLISSMTGFRFADVSCGFRAYSKEAMLHLNLTGKFTYTQETFIDLANKGLSILTVAVNVKYFPERESRVATNLLSYMIRTIKIILRAYRDYKPLRFFGWLGLINIILGLIFGGFVLFHYIRTSAFSPYKFVVFIGVYFFSIGLLLWIVGLLADMFVRYRINQEKILYYQKKRRFSRD